VTQARGAIAATKADLATVVLAAETSTQEATAERDDTTLCIKDKEDRAALAEEALERVSRAKGFELCHAIIGPPLAKHLSEELTLLQNTCLRGCSM
jgi:hypothetical protein